MFGFFHHQVFIMYPLFPTAQKKVQENAEGEKNDPSDA